MALSFGSKYTHNTGLTRTNVSCSLSSSVIVDLYYRDTNASLVVKAGSISGGVISYGGEIVVTSNFNNGYHPSITKIDSTHFVMSYYDWASDTICCRIGSILGTAITLGTKSDTGWTPVNNSATSISLLDSTHFVVGIRVGANSLRAGVGVFSGSTISSYGTFVQIDNGTGSGYVYPYSICTLDSTHFVFAYRAATDSDKGKAVIGVVSSGTTITPGSKYIFESSNAVNSIGVTPLSSTTFIVAWDRALTTGQSCLATVTSGDTISYGSDSQFSSAAVRALSIGTLDSTNYVIAYNRAGATGYVVMGTNTTGTISYGSETQFESNNIYTDSTGLSILAKNKFQISYNDETGGSELGRDIIGSYPYTGVARVLVLGGGAAGGGDAASGGNAFGAGGGAGGYRYEDSFILTPQTYSVIVGATVTGSTSSGTDGNNSIFDTITAYGGGGGGAWTSNGKNGGCGGGAGRDSGGTVGIGSQGGNGGIKSTGAGGGGGTNADGGNAAGNEGGVGGDGIVNNISGSNVTYGGGGAGSGISAKSGGAGGGGSSNINAQGGNGTDGLGGGGGGSGDLAGGNGGSGRVIVRWTTADFGTCSVTGTGNTITTNGSDSIADMIISGNLTITQASVPAQAGFLFLTI